MDNFLRSNIAARLIALLLAVVLWLFVTGDKITQTTPTRKVWQDVPLRVENLDQDFVITDIPSSVNVTLEGLPDDFEELAVDEIDTFVDLEGKEAGNHLIRVQGRPPRGLSLVLLEPEQVRVAIEAYRSDDFEIQVEISGEPASGWQLAEYTIEPDSVLLGAPQSIFERIGRVALLVNINGMRLIESIEVQPTVYDQNGISMSEGLAVDPSLITVRLEFERIVEPEPEISPDEETLEESA